MFLRLSTKKSTKSYSDSIEELKKALKENDTVVIGAGAGLSTSAGYVYGGDRCEEYFSDFMNKYYFKDMYTGGFSPFKNLEEQWAYWSRYIYINRYMGMTKPVHQKLLELIKDKDYFVLTTNVDHCFQRAGFAKDRLFYTQGDFGLLQCSESCHQDTYDNKDMITKMLKAQGFEIKSDSGLILPEGVIAKTTVPTELVPYCPKCGKPMSMNLRADSTFVEDYGWHQASERYANFIENHKKTKVLFLELGVGGNTPVIIKYPFWKMTFQNSNAVYACVNYGEAFAPDPIINQSICIDADINSVVLECQK